MSLYGRCYECPGLTDLSETQTLSSTIEDLHGVLEKWNKPGFNVQDDCGCHCEDYYRVKNDHILAMFLFLCMKNTKRAIRAFVASAFSIIEHVLATKALIALLFFYV